MNSQPGIHITTEHSMSVLWCLIGTFMEIEMKDMKDKVLNWFATGCVGASSKAMALASVDMMPHDKSHPSDPVDLNRCLLLLEAVPEIRQHFDKVAAISETWAKLIARWDEIEQCFLDEVGLNWTHGGMAKRTYELMKSILC